LQIYVKACGLGKQKECRCNYLKVMDDWFEKKDCVVSID
jgi:hypothetical protein